MTRTTSPDADPLNLSERELIEWLGRVKFRTQPGKVPDPANQTEQFEKWVDDTLALLHAPRTQLKPGLLGWSFTDLWNIVSGIPGTLRNIAGQLEKIVVDVGTSIPNTLKQMGEQLADVWGGVKSLVSRLDPAQGLKTLAADTGAIVKRGVQAISKGEAAMQSFVSLVITNNLDIAKKLRNETHVNALINYFQNNAATQAIETAVQAELAKASGTFKPFLDQVTVLRGLENVGYGYAERFAMAGNSILKLADKVSPNTELLEEFLSHIEVLLFGRKYGEKDLKSEAEALGELLVHMMVNMNPVLGIVVRLMSRDSGGGLMQRAFPMWIQPGMLNGWLNAEPDYAVFDPRRSMEEIEFRREMVAAFDQYLRSESADFGKLLRSSDQRGAVEALLDVTGVVCSTLFGFVLRAPGLPSPSLPKMDFANPFAKSVRADDMGDDVAATLSRQIVQPMKSVLGVVLNGVWAFSPNNRALVETISGFLGHVVRSLLEFLMHDLFWSFEIHECYGADKARDGALLMPPWKAGETAQDGGVLEYRVFRRAGVLGEVESDVLGKLLTGSPTLMNLLKDYAAYREALRDYRGLLAYGVVSDEVKATTDFSGTTLTVKAESKWKNLTIPSIPVLRAYYNGLPIVLVAKGGDTKSQTYEGRFDNAPGDGQVWIRSNYGGSHVTGLNSG